MAYNPLDTLYLGLFSLGISLLSTLGTKYLTNQEIIREHKKDAKKLQERLRAAMKEKRNEEVLALNKEIMEKQLKHTKHSMRPLLFLFPVYIIVIPIASRFFGNRPIIPLGLDVPFLGIGTSIEWFWAYFWFSVLFTTLLRKWMRIE